MSLIHIASVDDHRLAAYRELKTSQHAKRRGRFIAEGKWLVQRLLRSSWETESVLVEERRLPEIEGEIPAGVVIYVARALQSAGDHPDATGNGFVERRRCQRDYLALAGKK